MSNKDDMSQKKFILIMISGGKGKLHYVKAEPPCNTGNLTIPLFKWHIVIAWYLKG
jgi:hypothetical protein